MTAVIFEGNCVNFARFFFFQCIMKQFCDIQNNQGLGKGYRPSASADNSYLDLDYSKYCKSSTHNCLDCFHVRLR